MLNLQDAKINDLNQRVETLEKHSYAEVAKSPPKPLTPKSNTGTNTSTNVNNVTYSHNIPNPGNKTGKKVIETKNTNLTPAEIMDRARNIVGIFPINTEDIKKKTPATLKKLHS